jgi:hypothetical protein
MFKMSDVRQQRLTKNVIVAKYVDTKDCKKN